MLNETIWGKNESDLLSFILDFLNKFLFNKSFTIWPLDFEMESKQAM